MKDHPVVIGFILSAVLTFSFILIPGCIDIPDSGKVQVVVTILPQKEAMERIGGDLVEITVMIPKGSSPHSYDPLPSQQMRSEEEEQGGMSGRSQFIIKRLGALAETLAAIEQRRFWRQDARE